jgi:hypothetical protein
MWWFALLVGMIVAQPMLAATAPGYTVNAIPLTLSGQGSGVSQYTMTSVQGFTGQVIVKCIGPNPNLLPFVVIPQCSVPEPTVTIPAGGSVGGTINFFPPWTATQASAQRDWPVAGGLMAGLGLIGFRRRKWLHGRFAILAGILALFLLAGLTGCIGGGGLAMTPGVYTFVISGTGSVSASANLSVTVKCNSCPNP